MQSIVLFSQKMAYYQCPVAVGTYLFCADNNYNIIGLDANFEEFWPFLQMQKKLVDETIVKLITYIAENNYIEKLAIFYKDHTGFIRVSKIIYN